MWKKWMVLSYLHFCVIKAFGSMTTQEAKQIPLADLLARLGHEPVDTRQGGNDLWYFSPFRDESEPSFHVNVARNIWNDFGDTGGNLLDFVMRYRGCDLPAALSLLETMYGAARRSGKPGSWLAALLGRSGGAGEGAPRERPADPLELERVQPLQHVALLDYLRKRCIDPDIARVFLQEAYYRNTLTGRTYFALAFRNGSGGYELRNPYFKSSVGAKGMTFLGGVNRGQAAVFEGFMDLLSSLTDRESDVLEWDALVLNSLVYQKHAAEMLAARSYERIYTFFDNDRTGQEAIRVFQSRFGERHQACNRIYAGYKDYNEYLVFRR